MSLFSDPRGDGEPSPDARAKNSSAHFADSFDPAPSKPRHDGWSAAKQRRFIEVLAETGCVSRAADAVCMSARSAYRLRTRPGGEDFAAAWQKALVLASTRLAAIAYERAIEGVTETVRNKDGELVAERTRHSDRLLIFLLSHLGALKSGTGPEAHAAFVPDPLADARATLPRLLGKLADQPDEDRESAGHVIAAGTHDAL